MNLLVNMPSQLEMLTLLTDAKVDDTRGRVRDALLECVPYRLHSIVQCLCSDFHRELLHHGVIDYVVRHLDQVEIRISRDAKYSTTCSASSRRALAIGVKIVIDTLNIGCPAFGDLLPFQLRDSKFVWHDIGPDLSVAGGQFLQGIIVRTPPV